MPPEIVVALFSCAGTVAGAFLGVVTSQKLTDFRLKSLEEKVSRHNSIMERTFVLEEKMKVANHRIEDLEEGLRYDGE